MSKYIRFKSKCIIFFIQIFEFSPSVSSCKWLTCSVVTLLNSSSVVAGILCGHLAVTKQRHNKVTWRCIFIWIHWLCYSTVHVHVVIHFCDCRWCFRVEANLQVFVTFVYVYYHEDQIIKMVCDAIIKINPAIKLWLSQSQNLGCQHHIPWYFCVGSDSR